MVTVLFSDLTGFTALTEKADPEDVQDIMGRVFGGTRAIVAKYGGIVDKYIGDAVMAVFGIPEVHEDDSVRAIRAAIEIRDFVRTLDLRQFSNREDPLAMHAGINTGMVVTGEIDIEKGAIGIVGDTVNLASRLCSHAKSGEILISEDTRVLSERYFELATLVPVTVKGKADPVRVHQVIGAAVIPRDVPVAKVYRSALIGRDAELAVLDDAIARLRDKRLTVVFVTGEPGSGKSRLVEEFRARHEPEGHVWLKASALPYTQNFPYYLLTGLLRSAWKIDEGEAPDGVKSKILTNLQKLGVNESGTFPYIGGLFSQEIPGLPDIGPESWKKGLFAAIVKIFNATASSHPTVFVLEDLHWADPSSLDLIEFLFAHFSVPSICICTCRPPLSQFGFIPRDDGSEGVKKIHLDPLKPVHSQEMAGELLGDPDLPRHLREFLEQRAEGNPFFLEEIVRALVETGTLVHEADRWSMKEDPRGNEIPLTVQGVISARIDLLGSANKRVLQEASVIGRKFLTEVLRQISLTRDRLPSALTELESSNLIRLGSAGRDQEYEFRHVLTQEVAYGSLLRKERQQIHERIALAIEEKLADRMPDLYEVLAFHFKKSNSLHRAVHYLMKAGDKCVSYHALEEAHGYYQEAFDLVNAEKDLPNVDGKLLVEILNRWAVVYQKRGLYRQMNELLEAHKELAESLDDKALKGMFFAWLGGSYRPKERYRDSYVTLRRALRLAEAGGDRRAIGNACTWLSWTCAELGLLDEGVQVGERALEIGKEFPSDDFLFHLASGAVGYNRYYQGNREEVLKMAASLLEYGRKNSSDLSLSVGYTLLGAASLLQGDVPGAIECARASLRASTEPVYSVTAKNYLGYCLAKNGQFAEAEAPLREAIAFSEAYGYGYIRANALTALGAVMMANGQMARGMKVLQDAARNCLANERIIVYAQLQHTLGQIYFQMASRSAGAGFARVLRNLGFLLRTVPVAASRAEFHFKTSIDIAEKHGARAIAGASYQDLGRLYMAKDRRAEANECFAKAESCLNAREADDSKQALGRTAEPTGIIGVNGKAPSAN